MHNHFESDKDTANGDLRTMLLSFAAIGRTKVPVTDHGVMSAYEDAKDMLSHLQAATDSYPSCLADAIHNMEIIPGVEAYLDISENSDASLTGHFLLIAKDYTGYQCLCRAVSASAKNYNGKPILTVDMLRRFIDKGHVAAASACVAGVFGMRLGLFEDHIKEKLARQMGELADEPLDDALLLPEELLSASAFTRYQTLPVPVTKSTTMLLRDILAYTPADDAHILYKRFLLTKANEKLCEALRKEKAPKATEKHPVSQVQLAAYGARHGVYVQYGQGYTKHKLNTRKWASFAAAITNADALDHSNDDAYNRELYQTLIEVFGMDDFYFELQYHGLEEERTIYRRLIDFARELGNTTHFIVSNDVHVGISRAFAQAADTDFEELRKREVLKRHIIKFTRFNKFLDGADIPPDDYEYYIKDDAELREALEEIVTETEILDNAFANRDVLLASCHVEFPEHANFYPDVSMTDETGRHIGAEELFDKRLAEGIENRYHGQLTEADKAQIDYEAGIIKSMGYAAYHVIVQDYLAYGRLVGQLPDEIIFSDDCPYTIEDAKALLDELHITPNAYPIGPGRGSAVGSKVCYVLGITDIDPTPYGLYFERFLNPERVSMPDIDSDFSGSVREACIEYVKRKYGYDCVCAISTKSYAAAKGAIRIAARYLCAVKGGYEGEWNALADKLCKLYNDDPDFKSIHDAASLEVLRYADLITGLFTGYGQHAAGTIISGSPICDCLPLMCSDKKRNLETSCNMGQAEAKGFLKMDFLGLDNLNIITRILRITKDTLVLDHDRQKEMLDESRIYSEVYAKALTQGVFQFESPGMKATLQRFKPQCFEDIIMLVAVYRPGPLNFIDEIIAEKWYRAALDDPAHTLLPDGDVELHGTVYEKPVHSINIDNAALKEILAPTYGCIIYQEQIMQICTRLAGYSMSRADNVRKYMSKKKQEKLNAERPDFVAGCMEYSGISRAQADGLFDCMIDFAKYAFNKAHALAYALISVITAYLKLHYPGVFFAESLNAVAKLDEILDFTKELPAFGLTLHAPSLRTSSSCFTCVDNDIYYGLSYVNGLSDITYTYADNFFDFVACNHTTISAKTMEKLIRCGLFDDTGIPRKSLIAFCNSLYKTLEAAEKTAKAVAVIDTQLAFLSTLSEKSRLSAQEKADMITTLKLRRRVDSLSIKDVAKYTASITEKRAKKLRESEKLLLSARRVFEGLRLSEVITRADIAANRADEQKLLGYVFDIRASLETLSACNAFPAGTIDMRTPITTDIPNLGLIVINPCVRVTPGGWTKVLCCDKNRIYKYIYFEGEFPSDITEFVLNFKAEHLQESRKKGSETNSNNMYIAPHAYHLSDIGYKPLRMYYVEHLSDFRRLSGKLDTHMTFPTATLTCLDADIHIPCRDTQVKKLLEESHTEYVCYEQKKLA